MSRKSDLEVPSLLAELGFAPTHNVAQRFSISDLFPKSRRCGIYALGFANGDYYIGRSVDVVRRFGDHCARHDDIISIAFKEVPKDDIAQVETATIRRLERDGARLRNVDDMTVVLGETDLDLVMSREAQDAWLNDDASAATEGPRPNDPDLRRRLQDRWDELAGFEDAGIVVEVLRRYLTSCIPDPCRTELSFWSVSCLPYLNDDAPIFRININRQEVFAYFQRPDEAQPACYFQIRRSILADGLRVGGQLPSEFTLYNRWYRPAGPDQICVVASALPDALALLELPWFRRAAKDLNLNLMRKGGNLYASSHCFTLVDAAWGATPNRSCTTSLCANALNRLEKLETAQVSGD